MKRANRFALVAALLGAAGCGSGNCPAETPANACSGDFLVYWVPDRVNCWVSASIQCKAGCDPQKTFADGHTNAACRDVADAGAADGG